MQRDDAGILEYHCDGIGIELDECQLFILGYLHSETVLDCMKTYLEVGQNA